MYYGEVTCEIVATIKVGSRHANYPMIYNWGSIETFFQFKYKTIKCNLRDSLVPAAAVIPAQIVYIKVVAVKKSTLLKILLLYKKYFVD